LARYSATNIDCLGVSAIGEIVPHRVKQGETFALSDERAGNF
jgi:hypothetical protein